MIALAGPWPIPAEPHERLREHVVQAVDGRVDRVAGQQRGERERVAVGAAGARPGADDQPRRLERRQRRDRVGARRARALGGVAERVERAGGQLGLGLGGRQRRVVDHDRRAHVRVPSGAPAAWRCTRVISAPESVVGIAIARAAPPEAAASAFATSTTRPPPSATIRSSAIAPSSSPASSSTRPGATSMTVSAASTTSGAAPRARSRGQQRVARPAEHADRLGRRPAAEADRPLAVLPGEAALVHARHGYHAAAARAATRPGTARRSARARGRAPPARRARAPRSRAGRSRRPGGCGGRGSRPTAGGRARAPARPAAAAARPRRAPTAARSARARSAAPWPAPPPRARRRSAARAASPARRSSTAPAWRTGARR